MELDNFYNEIRKRLDNNKEITLVVEGIPQEGMGSAALKTLELCNKLKGRVN